MEVVRPDSEETQRLLDQLRGGDRQALEQLLARHRGELRQAVELRLDPAMRGRVDPSDVVQEAQAEAARRIDDYLRREPMPFHLWLRKTAYENLLRIRRQHVEAGCRSVRREMALPEGSSVALARMLFAQEPTPSRVMAGHELAARLSQAMAELSDEDREILLLRNFDGLGNQEAAQLLGIGPDAASKRYGRAILRLRKLLLHRGVTESQA
jgi:RNA polymerase sigma-70 factor (ECF subfamily)